MKTIIAWVKSIFAKKQNPLAVRDLINTLRGNEIDNQDLLDLIQYASSRLDKGGRRSGRTTRLADYYIQSLFMNNEVSVKDHYCGEPYDKFPRYKFSKHLVNKIEARLFNEHGLKVNDNYWIDKNRDGYFKIKMK